MQLGGGKNFFLEFWNIWECLSVEEIRGATQMPTQSFLGILEYLGMPQR
jgi:hypothetical protein